MSTTRMSDETRRQLQAAGLLDKAMKARFNTLDPRVQGLPDDAMLDVPPGFQANAPDTWYASTPGDLRRVIREVMERHLPGYDPAEQDPYVGHEAEHAAAAEALGCTVRYGFTAAPFTGEIWSWGPSIEICGGGPLSKLAFASIAAAPARLSDGDLHDLRALGYQDAVDVADRIRRSGRRIPIPLSVRTGNCPGARGLPRRRPGSPKPVPPTATPVRAQLRRRNQIMAAPITPYTDPGRFTDEEKRLFDAGKCSRQTAYGLPHAEYCGQPSQPGADFGNCPGHADDENTQQA